MTIDLTPARRRPERGAARQARPFRSWLGLPGPVGALAACHFVSRAGGFAQTFLVLYLTQERRLSPATAGAVAATVGAGTVGSLLAGGWLSDRIGRRRTMVVGFLGTAFALIALRSADTMPAIWVSAVGVGLASELFRPAGSATVADLRGGYMGVAAATWGAGSVLGPLLGTAVLGRVGPTVLRLGCPLTGITLFAAQQAVAPALRRRTSQPVPQPGTGASQGERR